MNHTWVSKIGESHFKSVAFALCLVFLMASLVFGSFSAGFLALLPVMVSIMIIYAVMVFNNIWLGIGTSMLLVSQSDWVLTLQFILWIESNSSHIIKKY